jgi:uncharacterized membrane protein YesL
MNWLSQYLTKAGPGVSRHAPRKHGLALLADVVAREWWTLIELNLLYALCCLPLVTIPTAQVAMTRICVTMIEDRNVYLVRDFRETFVRCFWQATAFGAVALLAVVAAGYSSLFFAQAATVQILFVLPMAASAAIAVFAMLSAAHGFTLLAMGNQSLAATIRMALLGALARPLPALAAFGVVAVLWLLHVAFYPASIFMPAIFNFSYGTLAVTFGVHKAAASLIASRSATGQDKPAQEEALDNALVKKGRKLI